MAGYLEHMLKHGHSSKFQLSANYGLISDSWHWADSNKNRYKNNRIVIPDINIDIVLEPLELCSLELDLDIAQIG